MNSKLILIIAIIISLLIGYFVGVFSVKPDSSYLSNPVQFTVDINDENIINVYSSMCSKEYKERYGSNSDPVCELNSVRANTNLGRIAEFNCLCNEQS